jgi:hypothetical protein
MAETRYGSDDFDAATVGESAADVLDSGRQAAVRGIQGATDALRSTADKFAGTPRVREFADGAARALDGTAKYLRDRSGKDMLTDLQTQARANPVPFLLGALAVGFLAGRMIRRG